MEINAIIKYPVSTEKTIRLMEAENKLGFIVDKKATKQQIKQAIQELFKAKVTKVNTFIGPDGKKKSVYFHFR